mmetsp:Transcript_64480/g.147721  ORF Transcript_64480/g.147721 Transcript_64480/m.147721 type:complete len:236 (+) Transcript_64480:99-806(+)
MLATTLCCMAAEASSTKVARKASMPIAPNFSGHTIPCITPPPSPCAAWSTQQGHDRAANANSKVLPRSTWTLRPLASMCICRMSRIARPCTAAAAKTANLAPRDSARAASAASISPPCWMDRTLLCSRVNSHSRWLLFCQSTKSGSPSPHSRRRGPGTAWLRRTLMLSHDGARCWRMRCVSLLLGAEAWPPMAFATALPTSWTSLSLSSCSISRMAWLSSALTSVRRSSVARLRA